jgi:hypothetical protein
MPIAVWMAIALFTFSATSSAVESDSHTIEIGFLDEVFALNMPSSMVAERLTKIRKRCGANLHFFVRDFTNPKNSRWFITVSHRSGGILFDMFYDCEITIKKGCLIRLTKRFTKTADVVEYSDVEDDLKNALVEGTVKYGRPIFQEISEKHGSIVWLHERAKLEIKKEVIGRSETDTVTMELVDERKFDKAPINGLIELKKELADDEANQIKANDYANQYQEAIKEKNYAAALEAVDSAIFYNPEDAKYFLMKADVYNAKGEGSKGRSSASLAFYILYKKDPECKKQSIGEMMAEAVTQEGASVFRKSSRMFEISAVKRNANYVISRYHPRTPRVYVTRAMCLKAEQQQGGVSGEKMTKEMICSDLRKACELGVCEPLERFQKEGECKTPYSPPQSS